MKTATVLFAELRKRDIEYTCLFRFPDVHVLVVRLEFVDLEDEERDAWLAERLGWTVEEVVRTAERARLKILLCTESEATAHVREPRERGDGWLRALLPNATDGHYVRSDARIAPTRTLHFHGYKGGQGRSSCLGVLAKALAADGWRVLAVDVDLEAPSLDILFRRRPSRPEATLLGLEPGNVLRPDRVHTPSSGRGYVDLLACRPEGAAYDMESVALALRHGLDPTWSSQRAALVGDFARDAQYDVVFIDHRAGLSLFNMSWIHALPGPVIAFARLDLQWTSSRGYLPALFESWSDPPGVLVSFAASGEEPEDHLERNNEQVAQLLELLAAGLRGSSEDHADDVGELAEGDSAAIVEELRDRLVVWPADAAFHGGALPDPAEAGRPLRDAVYKLRRLLEVAEHKEDPLPIGQTPDPSGARDLAAFIATPLWQDLISGRSAIRYIFGRKGTGKTRLLRELAKAHLGEALLIDPSQDAPGAVWAEGGLRSNDPVLQSLQEQCTANPRLFFLTLFSIALGSPNTEPETMRRAIRGAMSAGLTTELAMARLEEVLQGEHAKGRRRTFLLDGLESGFQARHLPDFVDGLFQTLLTFQTDPRLSAQIDFRVMARPDLVFGRVQNLEQQIHGQSVQLFWDAQAIFNFALSRVPTYEWFREAFPGTVEKIVQKKGDLTAGRLDLGECDRLFLELFPARLPRNGIQTPTFLRTYFADGDGAIERTSQTRTRSREGQAGYYPRIFDSFFRAIATSQSGKRLGDDGKIAGNVVLAAHDAAAADFLDAVRQELVFQVQLADDLRSNTEAVDSLVKALAGETSPFLPLALAERLATKSPLGLPTEALLAALGRMKDIGMFEEFASGGGRWRVGRLFGSALGMRRSSNRGRVV